VFKVEIGQFEGEIGKSHFHGCGVLWSSNTHVEWFFNLFSVLLVLDDMFNLIQRQLIAYCFAQGDKTMKIGFLNDLFNLLFARTIAAGDYVVMSESMIGFHAVTLDSMRGYVGARRLILMGVARWLVRYLMCWLMIGIGFAKEDWFLHDSGIKAKYYLLKQQH